MNIIFVCTGNTCRSVLAHGYLKAIAPDFDISSYGIAASNKYSVPQVVLKLLKEEGVDLSEHVSTQISAAAVSNTDYIFVMENTHKDFVNSKFPEAAPKTFLLKEFAGAGGNPEVSDPIGQREEIYVSTAMEIKNCVSVIHSKLKER